MTFTSDEVNYLIYRYLQESGFVHSAYTLSNESQLFSGPLLSSVVKGAGVNARDIHSAVPSGHLITLLKQALIYKEVETHVDEDGNEKPCNQPFSLIFPHNCKEKGGSSAQNTSSSSSVAKKSDLNNVPDELASSSSSVTILRGHDSEVFNCSWNPTKPILVSGSRDATARIWMSSSGGVDDRRDEYAEVGLLQHKLEDSLDSLVVTTLDWSPDGNYLASGAYDGRSRVWSESGQLIDEISVHQGPVFALKWNNSSRTLLSGSVDKSVVAWDFESKSVKQVFHNHSNAVLDVDWKDEITFASCSTDRLIQVCEIGTEKPVKTFIGHTDEVNTVKWDPNGILLASCSDDKTAKIWSLRSDKCLQSLSEHTEGIYTLRWSPIPEGSNQVHSVNLATASFDATVKIWDVEHGKCLRTLGKHSEAVCSIAFSPDGKYIVSGSFDKYLRIWSTKDGSLVKSYIVDGGVYEVSWNWTGTKIAGCTSNNSVCVIDFRM